LPDIDVIGSLLDISNTSLFGHRAITHSISFALVGAVTATIVFFRGTQWAHQRVRIGVILGLALLSHACLDALSTYSLGVEFFAPFSQQRFHFPWTPLRTGSGSLADQLVQETVFVLLPAVLIGWLGLKAHAGGADRL
jgi:inner membrane protein